MNLHSKAESTFQQIENWKQQVFCAFFIAFNQQINLHKMQKNFDANFLIFNDENLCLWKEPWMS